MDACVRIRPADGLLKRRENVVVAVSVPVISLGGFLCDLLRVGQRDLQHAVPFPPGGEQQFHRVHGLADIAAAGSGNVLQGAILRFGGKSLLRLHDGNAAFYSLQRGLGRDGPEFKHRRARQNGVVDVEIGIFRGGGDQRHLAVFDGLQQGLLLLLRKILDLVQVEKHAVGCHQRIRLSQDLPDLSGGSICRVELVERAVRLGRNDTGHSGLSHTGGTVKDQVRDPAGLDDPPEHLSLAEDMLLTHHIVQRRGADLIRQRLIHGFPSSLDWSL